MAALKECVVGVLALQGAFREHIQMLNSLPGVKAHSAELEGLDGIVLPGGESTTMGLIAERSGILPSLRALIAPGTIPVFATCAGLIMLAEKAIGGKEGGQPLLGGLKVTVDRNHFGSQLQSFETELVVDDPVLSAKGTCHGLFIRAPAIVEIHDPGAVKESSPNAKEEGECIVAARSGNTLAVAFHPELTPDTRWHEYLVKMIREETAGATE
eukprot:gene3833-6954_t